MRLPERPRGFGTPRPEGSARRRPTRMRWLIALLVMCVVAACSEREPRSTTAPLLDSAIEPMTSPSSRADPVLQEAVPRFEVEIVVEGEIRVDGVIRIAVRTTARVDGSHAETRVVLPEFAAAQMLGPLSGRLPVGVPLPPVLVQDGRLNAGSRRTDDVTLTIPWPGYYRVAVAVRGHRSDRAGLRTTLVDSTYREVWIFVDHNEGVVTAEYDPSVLPDDVLPRPGPLTRSEEEAAEPGDPVPATSRLDQGPALSGATGPRAVYYSNDSEEYEPIADAKVTGTLWHDELGFMGSVDTRTDEDGSFELDCAIDSHFDGTLALSHPDFWLTSGSVPIYHYSCPYPGSDHIVGSRPGRVWANMLSTVRESESLFDRSRSQVEVRVSSSQGCTNYSPSSDFVRFCEPLIWEEPGIFSVAHEYGHAFHHDELGGIQGSCTGGHYLWSTNTLACALSEGFANYYAISVRWDSILDQTASYKAALTDPHDWKQAFSLDEGVWCEFVDLPCSGQTSLDGGRAEAAVGAFLLDVSGEYGHEYVADVVEACQVNTSGWQPANGIDHLVICLERRLEDYYGDGYFPSRATPPTGWAASVSVPGGLDADLIEDMWKDRLYPVGPPSEPLDIEILGPAQIAYESIYCSWPSQTDGGTTPYGWVWTMDGDTVSTSAQFDYFGAALVDDFILEVFVTDADSSMAFDVVEVEVGSYQECGGGF